MNKTDLETRKYFEIEVKTTVIMWADSKEEAIEKFKDKYVNVVMMIVIMVIILNMISQ